MSNGRRAMFSLATAAVISSGCVGAPGPDSGEEPLAEDSEALSINLSLFPSQPAGAGSVFAPLPAQPGYPEGIVVVGDKVFVSGPATYNTAGTGPSSVSVFNLFTGASLGSIPLQGEDLAQDHPLSCITSDGLGRLYVLSPQLGVVRLTPKLNGTYAQSIYAGPFPDLPACGPGVSAPCSPTAFDGRPLLNDLAFDNAGNLYVTDSFQATIYRIKPGGGAPEVWFQSPRLAGPVFNIGLNGIRLSPDGASLALALTYTPDFAAGRVFELAIKAHPGEADLTLLHEFPSSDAPDGVAYNTLGQLYVALAFSNQIAVLDQNGSERSRFVGPVGSPIPFDGPANIAFDQLGSILVTNHASTSQNTAHFAVIEVDARDLGLPLAKPLLLF